MMSKFPITQLVYIDRLPLVTLSTDRKADKYNKLLFWTHLSLKVLYITEQNLTVDGNSTPNFICNDRTSPVVWKVKPLHRINESNLSYEDQKSFKVTKLLAGTQRIATITAHNIVTAATPNIATAPGLNGDIAAVFRQEVIFKKYRHTFWGRDHNDHHWKAQGSLLKIARTPTRR